MTVDRITKEKLTALDLAARLTNTFSARVKSYDDVDVDVDVADDSKGGASSDGVRLRLEDDALQRRVTKPLQYYFLDPVSHPHVAEKKEDRLKKWMSVDPLTHDPRRVFCRLAEYVRKAVREYWLNEKRGNTKLIWEEHEAGFGISHWAVSRESEFEHRGELTDMTVVFHAMMAKMAKEVFTESRYLPPDQLQRGHT